MKNLTMPFTESGITFDLTGYEYFAFENCPGYQRRSPHNLAEMDIGWYDPDNQTLYIAELKNYEEWLRAESPPIGQRITKLFHKSLAVIAMLTAVRSGEVVGQDFVPCLPASWPLSNPVRLLPIIRYDPNDEVKLSFMRRKLEEYMIPQYLQLFHIASA